MGTSGTRTKRGSSLNATIPSMATGHEKMSVFWSLGFRKIFCFLIDLVEMNLETEDSFLEESCGKEFSSLVLSWLLNFLLLTKLEGDARKKLLSTFVMSPMPWSGRLRESFLNKGENVGLSVEDWCGVWEKAEDWSGLSADIGMNAELDRLSNLNDEEVNCTIDAWASRGYLANTVLVPDKGLLVGTSWIDVSETLPDENSGKLTSGRGYCIVSSAIGGSKLKKNDVVDVSGECCIFRVLSGVIGDSGVGVNTVSRFSNVCVNKQCLFLSRKN